MTSLGHIAGLTRTNSKLAKEAERALIEATQRLSPEERLNSFLAHCRLIMELHEAGQKLQAVQSVKILGRAREVSLHAA